MGSGARALGQSAFIAVADDATAASWNPAGLINLERPEASFVGAWRTTTKDYSVADPRVLVDEDNWRGTELNFVSYAHPMEVGSTDLVLSVNYHQVYDLGVEFNVVTPFGPGVAEIKGESEGAISAYSLAGGLSMPDFPEVTLGAGFNWYTQSPLNNYTWRVKSTYNWWLFPQAPPAPPSTIIQNTDTFDDFRGYNFTFGLLWDVYEKQDNLLTLGLVYHTPFDAEVDRELAGTLKIGPPFPSESAFTYPRERMDIDFPHSLGAGANYRFSDQLSMAFDVEWKEWSEFKQKYADGTSGSPIDDDTLAFRLGGEYLHFPPGSEEWVHAFRCGTFYEPRPLANDPEPLPVYGLSAGLGWTLMEKFSLDLAYQYRWGEQDAQGFDYEIKEQFFVASLIRYF
jgi:long-chain fatty acid transport protein